MTSPIFGVNMPLFDANEQMITSMGVLNTVKSWQVPTIRMPFRTSLSDAVQLQALQAIKATGATPLVIIHGSGSTIAANQHLLALVYQVFGDSLVYVEFGNEEDLAGVDQATYTSAWNTIIPGLRLTYPKYKYGGPANFQRNPNYIAYFAANAKPTPDFISWHEYVCSPTDDFQTVCMNHIANWLTHAQQTNAAVQAAIGTTIPFMISEWNMDPQSDPRYSNASQIGPWTNAALTALQALVPLGLIGAQIYCVDSHGDFALINGSGALTPQGTAWVAALGSTPTPTPTPPPPTPPPPTPSGVIDFEDGTTDGFVTAWGTISLENIIMTPTPAYTGSHALLVSAGSGYTAIKANVNGITPGTTVLLHVWSSTAMSLTPFAIDGSYHNYFGSAKVLQAGWNTLTLEVTASNVKAIGIQVNNTPGQFYLDDITW